MQLTGRRLLLQARTVRSCRLPQANRRIPLSSKLALSRHRPFSLSCRQQDDEKKPSPQATAPTNAARTTEPPGGSQPTRLQQDQEFQITEQDAPVGANHQLFATDVDQGLESLDTFQSELGISDEEMMRLMNKFPGIDMKLIEQLKLGNLQEKEVRDLLRDRFPNGPPESTLDNSALAELSDLEAYVKLAEKVESAGIITPEERDLLQSLHSKVAKDPDAINAAIEALSEEATEVREEDVKNRLKAMEAQQKPLVKSADAINTVSSSPNPPSRAMQDTTPSASSSADMDSAVPQISTKLELDAEALEKLSEEERSLLKEIESDPELLQLLQTESLVDFAQQMTSGQFSADFLSTLSPDELEGLEQMQKDPDFMERMQRIPGEMEKRMNINPQLLEKARRLGDTAAKVAKEPDLLLSTEEFRSVLEDEDTNEEEQNEEDEEEDDGERDELDEEIDNMSIEELEATLAEARKDPDFARFEQEMEQELEKKFGSRHENFAELRKRMLSLHVMAWCKAKASGVNSREAVMNARGNPILEKMMEGFTARKSKILDKAVNKITQNPKSIFENLSMTDETRGMIEEERFDNPRAPWLRKLDDFEQKNITQEERRVFDFVDGISEEGDLQVVGDIDTTPRREEPGFWNDEEDPAEEWGEDEVYDQDDMGVIAHAEMELHREIREYARWTAWELPLLHKLAVPFHPPVHEQTPLRFRYTTYMGENHPASSKVVCEFSPSNLPLSDAERLTLIKFAGVRYNPDKDVVKMSCESFETQAQNKRYLGDMVDNLIKEAKMGVDKFADVPVDTRHVKRKPRYEFPERWKLTAPRKNQLEEGRKLAVEGAEQRLIEGKVVDGLNVIGMALRARRLQPKEADPVMVGAGAGSGRRRLA